MPRPCFLLLSLMLLIPAARSEGAPIFYDFTVTFDSGALDGESFQGSFSVDGDACPGGLCDGAFVPSNPDLTLLSFDITFNGVAFDIFGDTNYPTFPGVIFAGGTPTLINYQTDATLNPWLQIVFFAEFNNSVSFSTAADGLSQGGLTSIQPQTVPEPASLLLLGLGAVGLGARRWRQRRAT